MKWSFVQELCILCALCTCFKVSVSGSNFPPATSFPIPLPPLPPVSSVVLDVLEVRQRIFDVIENTNTLILPVSDQAKTIDIYIDFILLALTNFDEISGEIDLVAAMEVSWTAANLPKWDLHELGGKKTFSLESSSIWTPQFLLLNPANFVKDLAASSDRLRIDSNQTVYWSIMAGIEASCLVNVANFPFDIQTCDVNIAVWGYDETEVTLHPVIKNEQGADYIQSSTWSLKDISIQGRNSATNTPFFQVTLLIQRHYEYYLLNVIMPPTLLSVLDPCVFILPASSGERMSFAVTCFLAFSVFMTLLGDNLPKSSVPVAHVAYFMMYMLIHSCAVTFCTIITLRVYNKVDTDEPISDWVNFIVRLLRLRFWRYRKQTLNSNEVGPKLDAYLSNNSVKGEKHSLELIDTKKTPNGVVNEKSHSALNDKELPSPNLWPKTSPNEPKITWNTVGRTLDAFFFTVFLAWMFFIIISSLISLQLI